MNYVVKPWIVKQNCRFPKRLLPSTCDDLIDVLPLSKLEVILKSDETTFVGSSHTNHNNVL